MPEMDSFPCPDSNCCNGDVLRNANPKCPTCNGGGTVVRPKDGNA